MKFSEDSPDLHKMLCWEFSRILSHQINHLDVPNSGRWSLSCLVAGTCPVVWFPVWDHQPAQLPSGQQALSVTGQHGGRLGVALHLLKQKPPGGGDSKLLGDKPLRGPSSLRMTEHSVAAGDCSVKT